MAVRAYLRSVKQNRPARLGGGVHYGRLADFLFYSDGDCDLFECGKKEFIITSKILFGNRVHDDVNNKYVLILSEGKIKGLNGDYLKVMDCNENKYIIKRDFLSVIE